MTFLDAVRQTYQLPTPNLPTQYPCNEKFERQHAVLFKKEGLFTLPHNKLRDITGTLVQEVCHDVAIEPIRQPVTDNNLAPYTANTNYGVRLDVSTSIFSALIRKHFLTTGYLIPKIHDTNPES